MNNPKMFHSTGFLLQKLHEERHNNMMQQQQMQNQYQQQQPLQPPPQQHPSQLLNQQYQSGPYTSGPNSYSTGGKYSKQQQPPPPGSQSQGIFPMPGSHLMNPDFFHLKMSQNSNQLMQDLMILPGSSMQQSSGQQRRQHPKDKSNKHMTQYNQHKNQQNKKQINSSNINSNQPSSSVTELPETFGLPSNNSSSNLSKTLASSSSKSNLITDSGISHEDLNNDNPTVVSTISPKTDASNRNQDDIEIISETNVSQTGPISNSDATFRNYLWKNYVAGINNPRVTHLPKPQSNFISNFNCINQMLDKVDFYNNKLRRCKPYSNIKINNIVNFDDDEEDDDEDNDMDTSESASKRIKTKQVIVIDDSNEESLHKPWITPELIKLIKHRNLLQTKINEKNISDKASESETNSADAELLKKFKNLRNKVTKLVKKARKDYIAKYIKESKENKGDIEGTKTAVPETSSASASNNADSTQSGPVLSVSTTTSTTTTTTTTTAQVAPQSPSASNKTSAAVKEITSKLTSATSENFLQNQTTKMMTLYNNYFNQYIQHYQQQQQQLAASASKTTGAEAGTGEASEGYDSLQKQAAYYAQQQLALQKQLEASLTQSAQQLISEIVNTAVAKTNQQPFVLNQYPQQSQPQQQQHHYHLLQTGIHTPGGQALHGMPHQHSHPMQNLSQIALNPNQIASLGAQSILNAGPNSSQMIPPPPPPIGLAQMNVPQNIYY